MLHFPLFFTYYYRHQLAILCVFVHQTTFFHKIACTSAGLIQPTNSVLTNISGTSIFLKTVSDSISISAYLTAKDSHRWKHSPIFFFKASSIGLFLIHYHFYFLPFCPSSLRMHIIVALGFQLS